MSDIAVVSDDETELESINESDAELSGSDSGNTGTSGPVRQERGGDVGSHNDLSPNGSGNETSGQRSPTGALPGVTLPIEPAVQLSASQVDPGTSLTQTSVAQDLSPGETQKGHGKPVPANGAPSSSSDVSFMMDFHRLAQGFMEEINAVKSGHARRDLLVEETSRPEPGVDGPNAGSARQPNGTEQNPIVLLSPSAHARLPSDRREDLDNTQHVGTVQIDSSEQRSHPAQASHQSAHEWAHEIGTAMPGLFTAGWSGADRPASVDPGPTLPPIWQAPRSSHLLNCSGATQPFPSVSIQSPIPTIPSLRPIVPVPVGTTDEETWRHQSHPFQAQPGTTGSENFDPHTVPLYHYGVSPTLPPLLPQLYSGHPPAQLSSSGGGVPRE